MRSFKPPLKKIAQKLNQVLPVRKDLFKTCKHTDGGVCLKLALIQGACPANCKYHKQE